VGGARGVEGDGFEGLEARARGLRHTRAGGEGSSVFPLERPTLAMHLARANTAAPPEPCAQVLQTKVGRLRRSQDTAEAVQELELELSQVRKQLKCSVCCERQKNVIIKKCWHMFCKQCVDRVIEARSRKCPG